MSPSTNGANLRMVISSLWLQVAIVTFLAGFAVLLYLAYRVHAEPPPIPGRMVAEDGSTLFTGDDIMAGQHIFQKYGLMQYGTIFGHGAYLGPDFTAQYLHEAANAMVDFHRGQGRAEAEAHELTSNELKQNRYDPQSEGPPLHSQPDSRLSSACPVLYALFWPRGGADRIAATGYYGWGRDSPVDGLFCLVGMGGGRHTAWHRVLLYQQLAVRTAGR